MGLSVAKAYIDAFMMEHDMLKMPGFDEYNPVCMLIGKSRDDLGPSESMLDTVLVIRYFNFDNRIKPIVNLDHLKENVEALRYPMGLEDPIQIKFYDIIDEGEFDISIIPLACLDLDEIGDEDEDWLEE